ncbi:MAG: glycosyltransferase family 2 protein [Dehalococcoidia bacterium]
MGESPLLSVVITSHSTERLNDIFELLGSIKDQTYANIETIFVVERSQELGDRIEAWAHEEGVTNIRVVPNTGEQGLSAARNLGIKCSHGDIIAFVDDDVVLFPDWAEELVGAFKDGSIIGVTGSALPLWENDSIRWLPEEFYWLISCTAWTGWAETRTVRGAFGANMAFRKQAFENGCLFSHHAGFTRAGRLQPVSDDIEFSLRLRKETGRAIVFAPKARVWHRAGRNRLSLRFVAARSYHIGHTRRILKRFYAAELGPFEQEQQVLKGTIRLLSGVPKEFFARPGLAWKKLSLITTVLMSAGLGYLVPAPFYSPIGHNWSTE